MLNSYGMPVEASRTTGLYPQNSPSPPSQKLGPLTGIVNFLKSHPVLFLILLTPGIPEYLSASSNLSLLVFNPPLFYLLLGANVALYGSGVLLIREAMIRWKKGWASVFLLGAAYGIVEEGLALRTLFNPLAQQVGTLGVYGRWLGVNWIWTVGLLIFHAVYSIGLPIFLFGLVFPSLKRSSLVSGKGIVTSTIAFLISLPVFLLGLISPGLKRRNLGSGKGIGTCVTALTIDSIILQRVVNYDPGVGLLLFSSLVISLLVLAARKLPGDFLKTKSSMPTLSPLKFATLGALLFPASLITQSIAAGANVPPFITGLTAIALSAAILLKAFRSMGTSNNQDCKVALGVGLVIPVTIFGLIASFTIAVNPLILLGDLFFVFFSRRLWRKWHVWSMMQRSSIQTNIPGFGGSPASPFP